ncbi:MAG: GHKL domain-containing protein [Lachnospiraceae bacterium]|nr:GHKL domain-containing protein [Lachnospiraceae bacterium]MDD7628465.1 GHKL domain-containing protein [Lachnospiraceae bacterium]MDY4119991.1 GHKL domain-containing protein [Lachnospiraceae bacterium]
MIENIMSVLFFMFEALAVVFCLHYLYGKVPRLDIKTAIFLVIDVTWMEIVHFLSLGSGWTIIIYPVIAIYCAVEFGFNFKAILINNILYMAILSSIQATIIIAYSKVFKIERMQAIDNLLVNFLMFCVVAFLLKHIKMKKLSVILQSKEKLVMASSIIVGISITLFLGSYKRSDTFDIFYYVVLGLSILIIMVVVIDIGKQKIKTRETEAELRLHKLYESSFRELIDEICARQHEFDNHINAIYSQHRLYKTYSELVEAQKKYCGEIVAENRYNKVLSKGNPIIIGFLYSKFSEMERRGIIVTYQISIGDLKCNVPVYKMVELLGNLINNAIEAVQEKRGKIHVSMVEECDKIMVEISNENEAIEEKKIKDFFRRGYSEKGERRGYGLYNVGKICEEYSIAITCNNENCNNQTWLTFKLLIKKSL